MIQRLFPPLAEETVIEGNGLDIGWHCSRCANKSELFQHGRYAQALALGHMPRQTLIYRPILVIDLSQFRQLYECLREKYEKKMFVWGRWVPGWK